MSKTVSDREKRFAARERKSLVREVESSSSSIARQSITQQSQDLTGSNSAGLIGEADVSAELGSLRSLVDSRIQEVKETLTSELADTFSVLQENIVENIRNVLNEREVGQKAVERGVDDIDDKERDARSDITGDNLFERNLIRNEQVKVKWTPQGLNKDVSPWTNNNRIWLPESLRDEAIRRASDFGSRTVEETRQNLKPYCMGVSKQTLLVNIGEVLGKPHRSSEPTPPSTLPVVVDRHTGRKPDFRTGFGDIKYKPGDTDYEANVAEAIAFLIASVRAKVDVYSELSLLAALEKSLPFDVKAGLAHYNSLGECIEQLEVNFNNPGDLFGLRTKLSKAKFTKDKLCSVQGGLLVHRMQLYNKRCLAAGRARDVLSMFQMMQLLRDRVCDVNGKLALEIMDLWNSDPTAGFLANKGATQRELGQLEEKYIYLAQRNAGKKQRVEQKVLVMPQSNASTRPGFEWKCFRCGEQRHISLTQRPFCTCRQNPKCGVPGCKISHLTEFHDRHMAKRNRGSNWKQPNTQGGNGKKSKMLIAREDSQTKPSEPTTEEEDTNKTTDVQQESDQKSDDDF